MNALFARLFTPEILSAPLLIRLLKPNGYHPLTSGLKSGDRVSVAVENGRASSIKKLAGASSGYK